jgi:hypothetical protein
MNSIELLDLIGKYAGIALTTFVAGGAGAYLGSYLKKKGENLATHEDIDKLVNQVAAVTQTTKEIEAKISNDVGERQKRGEAKKDAMFETMKELATVQFTLSNYLATVTATAGGEIPDHERKLRLDAHDAYMLAKVSFMRASMIGTVGCGKTVRDASDKVELLIAHVAAKITQGDVPGAWEKQTDLIRGVNAMARIMRADLGIEDEDSLPTHQSSESSAVPTPDSPTPATGTPARH